MLKVTETKLEGVYILDYTTQNDNRGMAFTTFSTRQLRKVGIKVDFVESNVYCPTKAGTLYGIHFQNHPMAQSKLLYCIEGKGLDYAVDLRKDSPTYMQWTSVELSKENRRQIFIPKGFGHAFLSLEDHTRVVMHIDEYFTQQYSRQIAWNDPGIGIDYPVTTPIVASHDRNAPKLKESDCNL